LHQPEEVLVKPDEEADAEGEYGGGNPELNVG
jgi:hypothetical protein